MSRETSGARAIPLYEGAARERQAAAGGDRKSLVANLRQAIVREDAGEAAAEAAEAFGVSPRSVQSGTGGRIGSLLLDRGHAGCKAALRMARPTIPIEDVPEVIGDALRRAIGFTLGYEIVREWELDAPKRASALEAATLALEDLTDAELAGLALRLRGCERGDAIARDFFQNATMHNQLQQGSPT